jgi:hypothetical protein
MSELKTERLRAVLRTAEAKLKEILRGIETEQLDGGAVDENLREMERTLRDCRRAA